MPQLLGFGFCGDAFDNLVAGVRRLGLAVHGEAAADLTGLIRAATAPDARFDFALLATTAAKEQTHSGSDAAGSGRLIDSAFQSWLDEEREARGKYLDFQEFLPPDQHDLGG